MKRILAVALAMCLFASILSGCNSQPPADTMGAAQPGEGEETVYLLTMLEEKNEQGEVVQRITYTYDDRGLVVKKEYDFNNLESWNEELGIYEYISLPCDGVVDYQTEFAYDEYGNPTKFFDACYEYTHDSKGKITSFVETYPDQIFDYTVEYDASGNVKVFKKQRDAEEVPALRYEIEYDNAGRITQMTHYELDYAKPYRFEYDVAGRLVSRERIVDDPIMSESSHFTYDEAGRVVTETGGTYNLSYQYEDNMLVAINNERLTSQKNASGVLTVQCGDDVLTYTPVVLEEQDAALARNRWNQAFGRFFTIHNFAGTPLYAHHSMYDLDTVLLLPKEIF
jgi:YD repeat-containing protein